MARPVWQEPDDEPASQSPVQFGMPRLSRGVRWLMIANAAVFFVSFLVFFFGRVSDSDAWELVFGHLRLVPEDWRAFLAGLPVWQLFTYGFLHSTTDLWHLLMNLLTLYFFGTLLEGLVGTRRLVLTYFAAAVTGAALYLVPALAIGGEFATPVLGASGACFGVMVAAATLRPDTRVLFLFIPLRVRTLALLFVAYDVFTLLLVIATGQSSGTAHLVHLGGAVYGFLAVRSGLITLDPVEYLERRRAVKTVEREASDEARMDQLLAKIHREGMSALTRSEKEFLKRMSARR
jgi:membrane associated rhomboid family serine protease